MKCCSMRSFTLAQKVRAKLRFRLKSSRLMVEGCFLKRLNAARLSFIGLAMAGLKYGFFGLKFLITLDEMWLWIDCRNVDSHDDQAESISVESLKLTAS